MVGPRALAVTSDEVRQVGLGPVAGAASQVQTAGGSLAGNDHSLSSSTVAPPAGLPAPSAAQLVKQLGDNDPDRRAAAAEALARMGLAAHEALPALTRALQDSDERVRISAARAVAQFGPLAADAVSGLLKLLKDRATPVRRQAAEALVTLGSDAKGTAAALTDALKDEDGVVRAHAAFALNWFH